MVLEPSCLPDLVFEFKWSNYNHISPSNLLVPLMFWSLYSLFFTGCKNCANVACDVFAIEEDFGRARAHSQSGNLELVQQAIDTW